MEVVCLSVTDVGACRTVTATSMTTSPGLVFLGEVVKFGANNAVFEVVITTKSYNRSSFEEIVATR